MKKWYAIQTYAGSELKVADLLEQRVKLLGLENRIEQFQVNGEQKRFLVPIEEVITSKSRRGRSSEYRVPYDFELRVEPNRRVQKADVIAVKPPRYMSFDAEVAKVEAMQRVIIEMTNHNEEVFKIPLERRIRRDIRTGEKILAGVPLTTDRDPLFTMKVKGSIVQRDRIKALELIKPSQERVVLEISEKSLVNIKEGTSLKKGDLLERQEKIVARASGLIKVKEYKDKRVVTIQRIEKRRQIPGYIFARLDMGQEMLALVDGVKARFVGNPPTAVGEEDMKHVKRKAGLLLEEAKAERPKVEVEFEVGEVIEIVEGPFADFTGEITEIDKDREEVTVTVKIFGRQTPVKLGFEGIEKL